MSIRNYILNESADAQTSVLQYVETVKALLFSLLALNRKTPVAPEMRDLFVEKIKNLLSKNVDYTKKENREELLSDFQKMEPTTEGKVGSLLRGSSSDLQGISADVMMAKHSGIFNLQQKIIGFVKSGAGLATIAGAVFLGLAIPYTLYRKNEMKKNAQINSIVNTDVNPAIVKMARGIVFKKITSEEEIEDFTNSLKEGIIKKHFNVRP